MKFVDLFKRDTYRYALDWTPVGASAPAAKYYDYVDAGRVLLGYEVTVEYAHHRPRAYLFTNDEEKFGLVNRAQAYKKACDFYQKTMMRIVGTQSKTK